MIGFPLETSIMKVNITNVKNIENADNLNIDIHLLKYSSIG